MIIRTQGAEYLSDGPSLDEIALQVRLDQENVRSDGQETPIKVKGLKGDHEPMAKEERTDLSSLEQEPSSKNDPLGDIFE